MTRFFWKAARAGFVAPACLALALAAGPAAAGGGGGLRAKAELLSKNGGIADGVVNFEEAGGGVLIRLSAVRVPPGRHGFHIHETGDCSAPDGASAGGHFNPDKTLHGAPALPPDQRHAGDLGNAEADASGNVLLERNFSGVTLRPGPNSIAGRAVILHAGADRFASQPSGAAGARIACGEIVLLKD